MSQKNIIDFYNKFNEADRMTRESLEFMRKKEIIERYLHKDSMTVADIGGATGSFSFWLAQNGHKVNLLDITPLHLETAKQYEKTSGILLESIIVGDARNLPYGENSFDIVLLMGPLYHLLERKDRLLALSETYRVLKPHGILICDTITRFASALDGYFTGMIYDEDFFPIIKNDILTGKHIDNSKKQIYFTDAYFHTHKEIAQEILCAGFGIKETLAVESFGWLINDINEKIEDEIYKEKILQIIKMLEKEESLIGISGHLMTIAIK